MFGAPAAQAQSASGTRVEVPIYQTALPDGTIRYYVSIRVGGSKTLNAMIDTGSAGLRILPNIIDPSNYSIVGTAKAEQYGSGVQLLGNIASAVVHVGDAVTSAPIPIEIITTVQCTAKKSNCAASGSGTYRLGANGYAGEGFLAIMGIGLRTADIDNPLEDFGSGRWTVELPAPGSSAPGKLIINPDANDTAGYVKYALSRDSNAEGWEDDGLSGCVVNNATAQSFCDGILMDSGAGGVHIMPSGSTAQTAWSSGTSASLVFENKQGQWARENFAVGGAPDFDVDLSSLGGGVQGINVGPLPLYGFSVLYDSADGIMGLKPITPPSGITSATSLSDPGNSTPTSDGSNISTGSNIPVTSSSATSPSSLQTNSGSDDSAVNLGTSSTVPTTPITSTTLPSTSGTAGGLVPCSGPAQSGGCNLCEGVALVQNIIDFAVFFAFLVALVMFAWAGGLFMTSAANPSGISKARKIFLDAAIGFVFVLFGFLIIDTIIHTVIINQNSSYFGSNNWTTVSCTQQSLLGKTVANWLGTGGFSPGTPGTSSGSCSSGTFLDGSCLQSNGTYTQVSGYSCYTDTTYDPSTGNCIGDDTGISTGPPSVGGTANVSNPELASQLTTACSQYSVNCSIVSGIAQVESSGGLNCPESSAGAAGCMQVLADTACGVDSSISSNCSACIASKNSTSAACVPIVQTLTNNTQLATNVGVQYISQLQSMSSLQSLEQKYGVCQITAAAYFQGPGNVLKANGIPSNAQSYVSKACG
ncbi:MAG: hypothetical protein ACREGH_01680 [Minisyncoccia bacterium]